MVLEKLEALEGSTASDELVGEFRLVFVASTWVVDLLVGVLRVSYMNLSASSGHPWLGQPEAGVVETRKERTNPSQRP